MGVIRFTAIVVVSLLLSLRAALAQDAVFIQIEAQPSLARAEERARDYASVLQDVNGFFLGAGWYGIALGPYAPDAASALLTRLRRAGQIPGDSYIVEPSELRQQFWPVGAALNRQPTPIVPAPDTTAQPAPVPEPAQEAAPADETPREARSSERALDRDAREDLQVALQWAGFYNAAIDGAFGRGTRNAMAAWQQANNYEPTGILTTAQRAALLRQYNAVLDGLGMQLVEDDTAGIRVQMPTDVVALTKYESPFAHYEPTGDIDAKVLLISQPGDQTTLFGLYDIMQTLEIVPLDGPRERRNRSFTLTGANDRIVSYTEAGLVNGAVKGFTLVWPAGDEERRTRVLALMQDSFRATQGVIDPATLSDDAQGVDLVSGLDVRQPKLTRSGFFVDGAGSVVTTLDAVAQCSRITLNDEYEAQIAATSEPLGLAVLRPAEALAPSEIAEFRSDAPRLQSDVAVAGYSFGGTLTAPTLTFGTLADLRGLDGEENLKRLALNALPGDAGGPVLDAGGAVLGVLLPRENGPRQLPDGVAFAADAAAIRELLAEAGVSPRATQGEARMAPEDLTAVATDMTVLVSCWE